MKVKDLTHNVEITLTYAEAEKLFVMLADYKDLGGDEKIADKLLDKVDEYINT